MERAEFSLDSRIAKAQGSGWPWQVGEREGLAVGIATGLEFIHSIQLLHADMKPQNILVKNGCALLADFGLAEQTATDKSLLLSSLGLTPTFMPPELICARRAGGASSVSQVCVSHQTLLCTHGLSCCYPPHPTQAASVTLAYDLWGLACVLDCMDHMDPDHPSNWTAIKALMARREFAAQGFALLMQGHSRFVDTAVQTHTWSLLLHPDSLWPDILNSKTGCASLTPKDRPSAQQVRLALSGKASLPGLERLNAQFKARAQELLRSKTGGLGCWR